MPDHVTRTATVQAQVVVKTALTWSFGELGTDFSEGVCQPEESESYIRFFK